VLIKTQVQGNGGNSEVIKVQVSASTSITLVHGNLLEASADGIINAADPVLKHGGGVAKVIVDKGLISLKNKYGIIN
jgi:hypothetical protein